MAEDNDSGTLGTIATLVILLIVGIFFFSGWLSINSLIFLDRVFYISSAVPPIFAWGIAGATLGCIPASVRISRRANRQVNVRLLAIFTLVGILGIAAYNWKRTEMVIAASSSSPPTSKSVSAQNPPVSHDVRVVSGSANVRSTASSDGKVIGIHDRGVQVTVLEKQGNWCRVNSIVAGNTAEGWVHRSLLDKGGQ